MKHALIIDDEDDIRSVTRLALETVGGMQVSECSNAKQALEFLGQHKVDFVLLDYMMPESDGPATLKMIRAIEGLENLPVIFITARVQKKEIEHYKQLGVLGTITKPFDPMQLATQIEALLDS